MPPVGFSMTLICPLFPLLPLCTSGECTHIYIEMKKETNIKKQKQKKTTLMSLINILKTVVALTLGRVLDRFAGLFDL